MKGIVCTMSVWPSGAEYSTRKKRPIAIHLVDENGVARSPRCRAHDAVS